MSTTNSPTRLASAIAGTTFALTAVTLLVSILDAAKLPADVGWGSGGLLGAFLYSVPLLAFPIVGWLIATRRPGNSIGWICLAIGFIWELSGTASAVVEWGLDQKTLSVPVAEWIEVVGALWPIALGLIGTHLPMRLPDGRLPSSRWRWYSRYCSVIIALTTLHVMLQPDRIGNRPGTANPLGVAANARLGWVLVFFVSSFVGGIAALVLRYRRSGQEQRHQIKWVAFGGLIFLMTFLAAMITLLGHPQLDDITFTAGKIATNLTLVAYAAIPISIGIAILKYRLYGIDVVLNKAGVLGSLAVFITTVYVAIVVGIGSVFGSTGKPNLGLSILATAVVAIAFQPVRERVQRFANRLIYGNRATPYEILSQFSDRVAENYATEDVLPRMARTVAEGTGAAHAEVWLRSQGKLRSAAKWPEGAARDAAALALSDGQLPSFEGIDKAIPVRHQGELLGALTVTKPAGEPLTPAEEGLLADLASQAGLVLRNVGLTAELLQRLDELKASRQRLVAAQDQERRRLERDLHDGAQQHLVALRTRLALAERLTERDPGKAEAMIANLEQQAGEALDTLRDLARGIYPPLLAEEGLVAALEAQARTAPVTVEVHGQDLARYPQEIEAAVYFCCLEALQNVGKYAHATTATIELSATEDALSFVVRDDGVGFDPRVTAKGSGTQNMADRVAAMGGSLTVESSPGEGTAVVGTIPARALELVA
jgi:signal transduction histidine kinase